MNWIPKRFLSAASRATSKMWMAIQSEKLAWMVILTIGAVPIIVLNSFAKIASVPENLVNWQIRVEALKSLYLLGMAAAAGAAVLTHRVKARHVCLLMLAYSSISLIIFGRGDYLAKQNTDHFAPGAEYAMASERFVTLVSMLLIASGMMCVNARSFLSASLPVLMTLGLFTGGAVLSEMEWMGFYGKHLKVLLAAAVNVLFVFAAIYFPHHRRLEKSWFPVRLPRLKSARRAEGGRT